MFKKMPGDLVSIKTYLLDTLSRFIINSLNIYVCLYMCVCVCVRARALLINEIMFNETPQHENTSVVVYV